MNERPTFQSIFMNTATRLAQRSTCERSKVGVGAIITSTDFRYVYGLGYNGNAVGFPNKCDRTGLEAVGSCGCLHAEANAVINCVVPRNAEKYVFVTLSPCVMCSKMLINLGGVKSLWYLNEYRLTDGLDVLRQGGIEVLRHAGDV